MRAFYRGGWFLIVLACFGAVAETAARMVPHAGGLFLSAYDVWYALWPGHLVVTKIRIESLIGPWAWDPVMTSLLAVPLWALFGVPGMALVWLGWPRDNRQGGAGSEEEDALFLFDSLAERVEAEEREFAAFESEFGADQETAESPEGDAERHQDSRREGGEA